MPSTVTCSWYRNWAVTTSPSPLPCKTDSSVCTGSCRVSTMNVLPTSNLPNACTRLPTSVPSALLICTCRGTTLPLSHISVSTINWKSPPICSSSPMRYGTWGQALNVHCSPLRPTLEPSGHISASRVHADISGDIPMSWFVSEESDHSPIPANITKAAITMIMWGFIQCIWIMG